MQSNRAIFSKSRRLTKCSTLPHRRPSVLAGSVCTLLFSGGGFRLTAAMVAACGWGLTMLPCEADANLLIDPTGSTTLFTSGDDLVSSGRALGFTGHFFGMSITTVDVSTNGNLNFSSNSDYSNAALPNTVARIASEHAPIHGWLAGRAELVRDSRPTCICGPRGVKVR